MKKDSDKNSEELRNPAQAFVGVNAERQFEAQSSRATEQVKQEASDAREQALPLSLRSLQAKMNRNSKETSTQLSNILQKLERVDKELATAKRVNLTNEMLQIDVIDGMRDAISELKDDVGVVTGDLRTTKDNALGLLYELWVVMDNVKTVAQNFLDHQQAEDFRCEAIENDMLKVTDEMRGVRENLEHYLDRRDRGEETLEKEILEARDQITELWDEMYEVKDKVDYLEKQGNEQVDVETAMESLKNELKSVKDVATNLGKDVMSELNNVKEELRVFKEKKRGANVGPKEMVDVQEVMLYELRKVTDEVSRVKHDLRDIGVEVSDELAMGVGGRLRNVRRELKSIRHEMRAAKGEQREVTNADLDLIKEFNDTIRSVQTDQAQMDHGQNVKPTLDDLRDTFRKVMTKVINKKKRKQESRYPTSKQNKRLRKQRDSDERTTAASVPKASVVQMCASSSDSDSESS